jgi:hypothetical protein
MAEKRRVVVQGLGGAVPTLQAAIPGSVGQTRTQLQQATPWQESKLGQLSQALGVAVQGVGELKQIGEQQEQEFIEDLADKSAEEIDKALKDNRKKGDQAVRKNLIPFLGNPWNQERVRKAAGALLHDDFQLKLQKALEDSDPMTTTDQVVSDVIKEMEGQHDRLNDLTVRQGFNAATRDTIQKYTLAYNKVKEEQNTEELVRAGKSVLFTASTLNNEGELRSVKDIDDWWEENEGALKPADLFKLIEDVAVTHAVRGNEEAALEWVEYASGHLKVGTTKIGDPKIKDDDVFGRYGAEETRLRERIENIVTQKGNKEKADAALELQDIDDLSTDIFSRIKKGTYTTEEGDEISTQEEAFDYLVGKVQQSSNPYVKGIEGVSIVKKAQTMFDMPEDYGSLRLKQTVAQQFTGISSYSSMINLKGKQVLTSPDNLIVGVDGKTATNPNLSLEAERLEFEIEQLRQDKFLEVSSGTYKTVDGEDVVNAPLKTQTLDMNNWNKQYANMFQEKLEAYGAEKLIEKKAQDKIERAEPITSYIDPSTTVDDATSSFYEPHNFFDLEKNVKEGNFVEAKKIAALLSEKKYLPRGRERFETYQPLKEALNQIKSQTTSISEKEIARKKVLLYGIASKGSNFYNAENITRGTINIEGTEIKMEDKEALQDLSLVYPMISKKRLQQLSRETDPEANDIFELYNALFGTDLKEGDEKDEAMVRVFIEQQAKLYE